MTPTPGGASSARSSGWVQPHITETCDDAPPCDCGPAADGTGAGGRRAAGREHGKGCAHLVFPNLITGVATTDANGDRQPDDRSRPRRGVARKNLAPGRHYLDSGYLSAAVVVSALATLFHDYRLGCSPIVHANSVVG